MNRSSTPKSTPAKVNKPVHVPDPGVREAAAAFIRDTGKMPMFAPVAGPRLTPEVAPAAPADWVPHRPSHEGKKKGGKFRLETQYVPAGDQPAAIAELVAQAGAGDRDQVLLGVTGSGKTFTMAKVIEATQRPALILAPNKTLAAQLANELR